MSFDDIHRKLAERAAGGKLQYAQAQVSDALAHLAQRVFTPGTKLTLIARTPDDPEADFVVTDDDLGEAVEALRRRREAES